MLSDPLELMLACFVCMYASHTNYILSVPSFQKSSTAGHTIIGMYGYDLTKIRALHVYIDVCYTYSKSYKPPIKYACVRNYTMHNVQIARSVNFLYVTFFLYVAG